MVPIIRSKTLEPSSLPEDTGGSIYFRSINQLSRQLSNPALKCRLTLRLNKNPSKLDVHSHLFAVSKNICYLVGYSFHSIVASELS